MKISDAANKLREAYFDAPKGLKATNVHLFGIKYADQLPGMNLHDLAELAGLPRSYGVEINKGKNLAQFVELKS